MNSTSEGRSRLLERLSQGPVLCAEGYVFELERRGYIQAGAFVPEIVLERPEAVAELHREFMRAGSDVLEALTYYAHRDKLRIIDREDAVEALNRQALQIAKEVAAEGDLLVAGDVSNTNVYVPNDSASARQVRAMFEEQIRWALDAGVDYIIAETLPYLGEAEIALDVIRQNGATAVITLAIHRPGTTRDGYAPEDACKRLEDLGADVVGLNCIRGPNTMEALLARIRQRLEGEMAALPVAYRTSEDYPTYGSLQDPHCTCIPTETAFPTALDPFTCNRYEVAEWAKGAYDQGIRYLGLCCGAAPHHIRSMAEALGRSPLASRYSPDMSKHYAYGTDTRLGVDHGSYTQDL